MSLQDGKSSLIKNKLVINVKNFRFQSSIFLENWKILRKKIEIEKLDGKLEAENVFEPCSGWLL